MELAPKGWGKRLYDRADLEASYRELDGLEGYTGESLRGRLCSIRLRFRDADYCFNRTCEILAAGCEPVDGIQVVLNSAYLREHALLRGRAQPIARVMRYLASGDERARVILSNHRGLDAAEALWRGRSTEARALYEELLEEHPEAGAGRKASWHIGLAACEINLEAPLEALRHLTVAGRSILRPDCRTLSRAQSAAKLVTLYEHLEREIAASEWDTFLEEIECPEETKWVARDRAEILAVRSARLRRCVIC